MIIRQKPTHTRSKSEKMLRNNDKNIQINKKAQKTVKMAHKCQKKCWANPERKIPHAGNIVVINPTIPT